MRTPPTIVAFVVVLSSCYKQWILAVNAAQVNITVDDTDPSLVYQPSGSWHPNAASCSSCLQPNASIAFNHTWHDGTHIIPTTDDDDVPSSTSASSTSTPSPVSDTDNGGEKDSDDDDDEDKNKGKGKAARQINADNPFQVSKFDSDDPEFTDTPVTFQMNFTGSAVYLYCILPLGAAAANSTPTYMNLSYTLDGQSVGSFAHIGSASASGFLPRTNVLAKTGLSNIAHVLTVNIGPDSVFLFDYATVTQSDGNNPNGTSTSPGAQLTTSASPSSSPHISSHNVATFGGAVGGSFGVLTVLGIGIAASIYHRRKRAARRDRRMRAADREALHTDGSEDDPPMQGPAPFIPRYFPGTVLAAPPPYTPPSESPTTTSASSHHEPVSPAPFTRLLSDAEPLSYADRPPPTPPPPLEDSAVDDIIAPPSFGAAIATPIPVVLITDPPEPTHTVRNSPSMSRSIRGRGGDDIVDDDEEEEEGEMAS